MAFVQYVSMTAWGQLITGNVIGAVITSYTDVMGPWFYLLLMLFGMILIYMKTLDFTTTSIAGLIIGCAFLPFVATLSGSGAAVHLVYGLIVFAIAIILWKIFKGS